MSSRFPSQGKLHCIYPYAVPPSGSKALLKVLVNAMVTCSESYIHFQSYQAPDPTYIAYGDPDWVTMNRFQVALARANDNALLPSFKGLDWADWALPRRTNVLSIDTLLKASGYSKLPHDRMPLCPHSVNPHRSLENCCMTIHQTQHNIYGTVMCLWADKHECTFLAFPPQGWLPGSKANPRSLGLLLPLIYLLCFWLPALPLALRPNLHSGGLYALAIALGALKLHHLDFTYYMTETHPESSPGKSGKRRRRPSAAAHPVAKAVRIHDASTNAFTYGALGIALLDLNSSVRLPKKIWQAVQTAIRSCPSYGHMRTLHTHADHLGGDGHCAVAATCPSPVPSLIITGSSRGRRIGRDSDNEVIVVSDDNSDSKLDFCHLPSILCYIDANSPPLAPRRPLRIVHVVAVAPHLLSSPFVAVAVAVTLQMLSSPFFVTSPLITPHPEPLVVFGQKGQGAVLPVEL
ncbi:hypothetical protein B0H17DRAFT_1149567 [Mycena rosella]|uniref:Uncharacterized protein n=1 Tax=Mycena rosella TaxID=1033263 RepID=A0AAD7C0D7_MYCRO|nr:hypothetical protein B0H17DRAFT_1149567 [Mycena rosella]